MKDVSGIIYGTLIVAVITYVLGLVALFFLEETFTKDMNYTEEN